VSLNIGLVQPGKFKIAVSNQQSALSYENSELRRFLVARQGLLKNYILK